MVSKRVSNVDMSFTAEEKQVKPIEKATETFEKDGKVIYKKDETGFMQFYDADNNPVGDDVVEKLSISYQAAPYINDRGDEQEGSLRVRYLTQETLEGRVESTEVKSLDECDIIEERQYYKNGEAIIHTIPKKHYYIVKFLRGDYDQNEDVKEVTLMDKAKELGVQGELYPVENQEKEEEG